MRLSLYLSTGFLSALGSGVFAANELTIQMTPELTLTGTPGNYQIQRTQVLETATNWIVVTNIYLATTPFVFYDTHGAGSSQQYYRAVEQTPADINPYPQRLVWIPPGRFTMGSPLTEVGRDANEGPQTIVTITRGFFIQKYELTQFEYEALMGTNPSSCAAPLNPVNEVNWDQAVAFCDELTVVDRAAGRLPPGYVYRLPTEAEWEYACRAGTTTRFSYGNDPTYTHLGDYAWYSENSEGEPHLVSQKRSNAWDLYDMHGNLSEWCLDRYGSYPGGSVTDPQGPSSGSHRVLRGGGWDDVGRRCRSAQRSRASYGYADIGFRVVLAPSP
jgi:formylglycine-generating enzyme required for sulfatase activity